VTVNGWFKVKRKEIEEREEDGRKNLSEERENE